LATPPETKAGHKRPLGITLLSLFFVFGALMSGLTLLLLLFPATPLDILWRLNPHAREGLAFLGWPALLLMAVVSLGCLSAARGLWRCTRWGLWTAVSILAINLAGDTINALVLGDRRTLIGLPVGTFMLWYLLKQRRVFVA
jgi:hypothetical protein